MDLTFWAKNPQEIFPKIAVLKLIGVSLYTFWQGISLSTHRDFPIEYRNLVQYSTIEYRKLVQYREIPCTRVQACTLFSHSKLKCLRNPEYRLTKVLKLPILIHFVRSNSENFQRPNLKVCKNFSRFCTLNFKMRKWISLFERRTRRRSSRKSLFWN